ncbi:MAG: hypothetical protein HYV04_11460 [Deltaproteobacteria bacterium]|nr:hypothetical protein [Deltaproteobacteria bacterium]
MMRLWQRLSKREQGLVLLSLVILLGVVGRYFVLPPLWERREWVSSQLEIQPQLLERNLRFLNRKAEIAAALGRARNRLSALEPSLIAADTPSVGASELQQTVQALAAKEGLQVITTRVLNPEARGPFTRIPIQLEIGGEIGQLVNLIQGIESAEKLLVIDDLNVRSLFRPAAAPQPRAAPVLPQQNLRASITVSGLARSKPSPTKGESGPARTKAEERKGLTKGRP